MNLKDMTKEELLLVIKTANQELKDREESRYLELVDNACEALNKLKKEFPHTAFEVKVECEDCGEELYVDFFYEKEKITRDDFCG